MGRKYRLERKLFAYRINWKGLGRDLRRAPKAAVKFAAKPIVDDSKLVREVAKDAGKETVAAIKTAEKSVTKTPTLRRIKAANLKRKRKLRDLWNGTEGQLATDSTGSLVDNTNKLKNRALSYVNPAAMRRRYALEAAKELGVKDVAAPTNFYELYRKRLNTGLDVLNPKRAGAIEKRKALENVAANPGGFISGRTKEYIRSGGDKVLDDMVTADKIRAHVSAASGNVVDMIHAGSGFYDGDIARTVIRAGAKGTDNLINRNIVNTETGKSIRLGTRYKAAARKLGNMYEQHLEQPVAKLINTGGAAVSMATGNPIPTYAVSGTAPLMTGNTARGIMSKFKGKVKGVAEKLKPTPQPQPAPIPQPAY